LHRDFKILVEFKEQPERPDLLLGHRHAAWCADAGASESHADHLNVHGFFNHSDYLWFGIGISASGEIFKFV